MSRKGEMGMGLQPKKSNVNPTELPKRITTIQDHTKHHISGRSKHKHCRRGSTNRHKIALPFSSQTIQNELITRKREAPDNNVTSGDKDRSSRNQSITSGRPRGTEGWQAICRGGVRGIKSFGEGHCRMSRHFRHGQQRGQSSEDLPTQHYQASLAYSIHLVAEELVYFNKQPRHDSRREGKGGEEEKRMGVAHFSIASH
ncbi:hypothetical protein CEXT_282721 [Caerostris extrusa]|uniref:Uncharacterized protein n=1 Tax=Caerostris extrusa TaxID=172846 RepID=A0AAV4WFR3_CAEEX|nr:hypothetical protein CEXT_282721 [Caerostris extrusa]